MRVTLRPKQHVRLSEMAGKRGMKREELARQVICRYLEENKATADDEVARDDRVGLGTELAALFPKHGPDFVLQSPFDLPAKAAELRPADSRGRLSPHKSSRKPRNKRA
jgi:hypothetical protein